MENNPDMESFERFIKQQSDDFRMYPTRRVWYSLYNNLHPGRKWPSISMCIVLLTALFLIGFLNTSNNHSNALAVENKTNNNNTDATALTGNTSDKDKIVSIQSTQLAAANIATDLPPVAQNIQTKLLPASASIKNIQPPSILAAASAEQTRAHTSTNNHHIANNIISAPETAEQAIFPQVNLITIAEASAPVTIRTATVADKADQPVTAQVSPAAGDAGSAAENLLDDSKKLPGTLVNTGASSDETVTAGGQINVKLLNKPNLAESNTEANKTVVTNLADKSWIENYALYNKPAPKKWKGKLAWQAYFTPSVSYRKLFNNAAGKSIGSLTTGMLGSTDATLSKEVTQSASIGLEAGVGLQYPVLKGIKIKAGMQLNYTRYNIAAFENSHPSITSLEMLSEINGKPYELYKTTAYSNNAGLSPVTLHSQTFQLSLPVGADIKLAGNDLFEWYAGAAVQPTVVFGGSSYLISTDRRNYVKDHSMLNHFNMNAAFETYISFKSPGGFTWQIGPQLRKQLYSTSTKFYTVEERLMGYGLKIGFIKKL